MREWVRFYIGSSLQECDRAAVAKNASAKTQGRRSRRPGWSVVGRWNRGSSFRSSRTFISRN